MKCRNPYCGDKIEEYINDIGKGTRHCLAGCGFYEEFQVEPEERKRKRVEPNPPMMKKAKKRHG